MKRMILLAASLGWMAIATAAIRLPSLVGDNMVLQQQTLVNIWGWAGPGKTVTVTPSWTRQSYNTKANARGQWLLKLATPAAGGPYTIVISDGKPVTVKDVLIGEVWICSGQSNMEMPIHGFYGQPMTGGVEEIYEANQYAGIRLFTVPPTPTDTVQEDCPGAWLRSSPASVRDFSAVGYMFGKYLYKVLNIPVGLINANCGATAIESWMPAETIRKLPGIDQRISFTPVSDSRAAIPGSLYNGMIAPLTRYTGKGFIWYQGESNMRNYFDYDQLMAAMVDVWRKAWQQPSMPFYYVQLAPFTYDGVEKISLPLTIEAQYRALQNIPHAAIAATTDLGSATNIHPPRKKEIGLRLASLALRHTYGVEGVLPDAPMLDTARFEGNKAILTFKGLPEYSPAAVGSLLFLYGELKGFELAGEDRKFYPAKATQFMGKNLLELQCDQVPHPVAVRYAFRNLPDANVMTTEGQPLVPFRTDHWNDAY